MGMTAREYVETANWQAFDADKMIGGYRVVLTAVGYKQVDGVDYYDYDGTHYLAIYKPLKNGRWRRVCEAQRVGAAWLISSLEE